MTFEIPEPVRREHEELHEVLRRATLEPGKTGAAAKNLARLMHPHFAKEDQYALPPLALLPQLASGEVKAAMAAVLPLTDKLKAELAQMLEEHKGIVTALKALADAARLENKPEYVTFADKLTQHAQTEEQVTYPAALLIGAYVRAVLGT